MHLLFYKANNVTFQAWSLERRRAAMSHPTSQRLIDIMLKKKSNLCLAADITTASGILQVVHFWDPWWGGRLF